MTPAKLGTGLQYCALRSADSERTAMETRMKTTIFSVLMAFSFAIPLWCSSSAAQNQPPYTREELEDRRQEIVVRNMDLDDVQKAKFLEVYVPYQERLMRINRTFHDLERKYLNAQNKGSLSNDQAKELLDRGLKRQTERDENLRSYTEKLSSVLSPVKVTRAWQIENKLFSASDWVYTQDVPLAK
jgi:Spy/CpxP family protein refolding chaperone